MGTCNYGKNGKVSKRAKTDGKGGEQHKLPPTSSHAPRGPKNTRENYSK